MLRAIHAPEPCAEDDAVIFLAGPIQWGGPSWHEEVIAFLAREPGAFVVASPRRPIESAGEFSEADYAEQVDWETRYLRQAGQRGVVLFWLARERRHRCVRPHAQTTRFELAEWKERHQRDGAPLVIGIEEGFTGARYIRRRFAQDCPEVPIESSLEETCRAAMRALERRTPSAVRVAAAGLNASRRPA